MIENILRDKYYDALVGLDISENRGSLRLSRIIIKPEYRNSGIGSKIMADLVDYADANNQIIVLTPSSDFGGNKNRLVQFYKSFGFKHNIGHHKNYEFMDAMIRYPNKKLNESMVQIKQLLREQLLSKTDKDLREVSKFVDFCKEQLNIEDDIKIVLAYERTPDLTTTAYYNLDGLVKVYVKDRAIIDVCRSIAHELVHHKQNLEGRLTDTAKDGADGSDIENEANAVAGKLIRIYGKMCPELYK